MSSIRVPTHLTKKATAPSATGPAGSLFEAKVAAYYMLTMIQGGEPRGLPGTKIDRIALQQAAEGYPLDDIVIHAHDQRGIPATMEIQVKRSITFAPRDREFGEVVRQQIAPAIIKPEFSSERYELAVATNQATRVIANAYQEVLSQARRLESADAFFTRLMRRGSANIDMRTFASTIRQNLAEASAASDDETIWRVLRRLQIHVYDFGAEGSMNESYARCRAADVLHPDDRAKAGAFWNALTAYAFELSSRGGEVTRQSLMCELAKDFRFAGDRSNSFVRAAINEAAQQSLSDIAISVRGCALDRTPYISAVLDAAKTARYIEIRGDAGVGKSGLLRRVAETVAFESRILVLSPGRIAERGWPAMRTQFDFQGTLPELLFDLACDGGGWVFIDNLDAFTPDERLTVVDVVRAAAQVPGVIVVATARRRFGIDDPSWLPGAEVGTLGRALPINIEELKEEEITELRDADPSLRALLVNDHPARNITRNLFRLSRLVQASPGGQAPRSEVDMAEAWWRFADGEVEGRRVRERLLRKCGVEAIKGIQVFDLSNCDAVAINTLIGSETFRDLGSDRVSFRHDVLCEWAVANLLDGDHTLIAHLPLAEKAQPSLARGLELAARFAAERSTAPNRWHALLDALTKLGAHASWRRSVLLAPMHSEIVEELIPRLSDILLAEKATFLRQTISLMMAVDVRPLRDMLGAAGVDVSAIPESLNVPCTSGWLHLASWLLDSEGRLAPEAMPDVVEFLTKWLNISVIIDDALSLRILRTFKRWLVMIETASDGMGWRASWDVFGGKLERDQAERVQSDLRSYFVMLAMRVPQEAKEYLEFVQTRKSKRDVYETLLKQRGTLAQVAPKELAKITIDALVERREKKSRRPDPLEDAFSYIDHQFAPASPAQGPFFELLVHAPEIGLKLIRDLIEVAVAFHSNGRTPTDENAIVVQMSAGMRRFPWRETYGWSRASQYFSITSGLMALEAWAHARIEKGDPVNDVIDDVLGSAEAPAAYLLVIVDLLLSHWPAARAAAVSFVACPELLSLDLSRPDQERIEIPDLLGLKELDREPVSGPRLKSLKSRLSRHVSLYDVLPPYAINDWPELRNQIRDLLGAAAQRLGPVQAGDDLGSPRLMAVRALNLIDPVNYVAAKYQDDAGNTKTGFRYNAPESEVAHFAPFQEKAERQHSSIITVSAINLCIDQPNKADSDAIKEFIAWAQTPQEDSDHKSIVEQTIVGAALIAMRDSTPEQRLQHRAWAESVFANEYFSSRDHVGGRMRERMAYNPLAMAFAGRVFALTGTSPTRDDFRRILLMSAGEPAAARGAEAAIEALRALHEGLPRSILRVAFTASVLTWHPWDATDEQKRITSAAKSAKIERQINAELSWLLDRDSEPAWPAFPAVRTKRRRRSLRIDGEVDAEPESQRPNIGLTYTDHQSAALWLRSLWRPRTEDRGWARQLCRAYDAWTYAANGLGIDARDDSAERPTEWNSIFFEIAADALAGLSWPEVDSLIAPIIELEDESFFDVCQIFLRSLDTLYFGAKGIDGSIAAAVRGEFALRLARSSGWQRMKGDSSGRIEFHLGPAVAVHFFNDHHFGRGPKTYLLPEGIPASDVFIPVLQQLALSATSLFTANVLLNWLEVAPRVPQLSLLLAFGAAAFESFPDDRFFWIDHGIGKRVCAFLDFMRTAHPEALSLSTRASIDTLLANLVAVGVVEARRLEIELQNFS